MQLQIRERIEIAGLMPERALMRLRRAGVCVYDARKVGKDKLRFSVDKTDEEKVFALYGNGGYSPYCVRSLGANGAGRIAKFLSCRLGFVVGACLFCITALYFDTFIFDVEFSASSVYARETFQVLESCGVRTFAPYKRGKEEEICAQLLALDGVEFCSIKKQGTRLIVDMRLDNLPGVSPTKGGMKAGREGEIVSITVLKGTPQKAVGDKIKLGETLVAPWIETESGQRKDVDVVARAAVRCRYACVVQTDDEKVAFATAYLQAALSGEDEITARKCTQSGSNYCVEIEYIAIERMNF